MKAFMDDEFLLSTPTASRLYHEYADMRKIPVIDYHCHIDPKQIYEDVQFENITQVWLGGDHYKWRQMRTCGVDEKYITGDASDYEKFEKWAEIMPLLIGNPLYSWSHLELKYYFGYEGNLNKNTAREVWDLVNAKLKSKEFSVRNLIRKSNVKLICTTDDPVDSLIWHEKIKADTGFEVKVLPAFRPDKAMSIEKDSFPSYIASLAKAAGMEIKTFDDLKKALVSRMDYFEAHGCSVSDHGMEYVMYVPADAGVINSIFEKALKNEKPGREEVLMFKTACLIFLAGEYNKRNWVMQLHYGVKRDNNEYMFNLIGPDTGFDCIDDYTPSASLANFMNALAKERNVPKTIVYSLNPTDNAAIGTVIGCFQEGPVRNRIQQGSAWWFNDNYEGMVAQMKSLASLSALGNFVGMLTDSRSFLSYTRHDYFRRILCNLIGNWVENGEYPADDMLLSQIVKGISYNNTVEYFEFDLETV